MEAISTPYQIVWYDFETKMSTSLVKMETTTNSPRLTRDEWLERSLELLSQSRGHFRIDELVKKLGVTKGSFYWHFKNRDDFILTLLDYWEESSTQNVFSQLEQFGEEGAEKRLLEMMRILRNRAHCDHEIALRNMASWSREVADRVTTVDQLRWDFVRSLFSEMGYENEALEVRVHLFIVFHSMREGFFGKRLTDSEAELEAMHALFIRK